MSASLKRAAESLAWPAACAGEKISRPEQKTTAQRMPLCPQADIRVNPAIRCFLQFLAEKANAAVAPNREGSSFASSIIESDMTGLSHTAQVSGG
jgi:hypothetical protein